VRRVAVVCPTTPLTRQWARAAARLGVHLAPDASELRPPRDFHGVAVTYARGRERGRAVGRAVRRPRRSSSPTRPITSARSSRGVRASRARSAPRLGGCCSPERPFRSDQCPIPGVRYDDGVATPDVSYSYADAVRDGICRPVTFVPYDGVLQWRSGDDLVESSFADAVSAREAGRRYRTADLARAGRRPAAHPRPQRTRASRRSAPAAPRRGRAGRGSRRRARARGGTGPARDDGPPADRRPAHRGARGRRSSRPSRARPTAGWLPVNMVSEGVDIPACA
jgi:hypothetical protein